MASFAVILLPLLLAQTPDARTIFEQAVNHQKAGRLHEAERTFAEAARLAPEQGAIFANLGVVRAQLGDYEGALAAYRTALTLNPAPRIHLNMAIAHFKKSDFSNALESLDVFLKIEPGGAQASELRGLCLYQLGRFDEAAEQFGALIEAQGEKLSYLYALGQAAIRTRDQALSTRTFARMFSLYPDAPETHLLEAQALMSANRHEAAAESLDRATARNPGLPGLHLWRGIAQEGLGRPDEALKSYEAEMRQSGDLLAYYAAGVLEGRAGRAARAVELLERAMPIDNDRYNVSYYLGRAYLKLERYDSAIAYFERSLKRSPQSASEHYLLLEIYRRLGRTEDIRKQAGIIRELKSKQALKDRETLEDSQPFKP